VRPVLDPVHLGPGDCRRGVLGVTGRQRVRGAVHDQRRTAEACKRQIGQRQDLGIVVLLPWQALPDAPCAAGSHPADERSPRRIRGDPFGEFGDGATVLVVSSPMSSCAPASEKRATITRSTAPSSSMPTLLNRTLMSTGLMSTSYVVLSDPASTRHDMRAGCLAASRKVGGPPPEKPSAAARSMPRASSSATSASACCS
jgi:hypothetical protein